jgi:5-(carboxyamino)imidazole ribonucleotide synthase
MKNLLGDEVEQWRALAGKSDERLHLYGKDDPRRGRKMGHLTFIAAKSPEASPA